MSGAPSSLLERMKTLLLPQMKCEKVGKRSEELVKEVTDKEAVSGKGDLQQLFKSAEVSEEPPQESVDTGRNLLRPASSKQSQEQPSGSVQDFSVAVVSSEAGQAHAQGPSAFTSVPGPGAPAPALFSGQPSAAPGSGRAPVPHPGASLAGISPMNDDPEEGGGGADAAKTPVSLLQELCVRRGPTAPKYDLVQTEGPMHDTTFKYRVTIGELEAVGCGQSKKKAKQSAAKSMLEKLKDAEQLRSALELSAADTAQLDTPLVTGTISGMSIPSSDLKDNRTRLEDFKSLDASNEDEVLRRTLEISKTGVQMTDEEKMDLGIQLSKEVAFTASGTTPIPCPMVRNPVLSSSIMDFRFSPTVSANATQSQKNGYIGGKFSMNNNGKSANQIPLNALRKTSSTKKNIGVISERLLEMSGLWIDGVKTVQHRTRNSNTLPLAGAGSQVVQPADRSDQPGPSHSDPSLWSSHFHLSSVSHSASSPGSSHHHPSVVSHSAPTSGTSHHPPAASIPPAGTPPTPSNLRPIVLDGSNICLALGKGEVSKILTTEAVKS